jgi:hypothetical protein
MISVKPVEDIANGGRSRLYVCSSNACFTTRTYDHLCHSTTFLSPPMETTTNYPFVATFSSQRPSVLITAAALAVFYNPFTPYTTTGEYTGSSSSSQLARTVEPPLLRQQKYTPYGPRSKTGPFSPIVFNKNDSIL